MSATRLLQPRVCELGKIKIGGLADEVRKSRAGNEWRAPEKYDHFVITGLTRDGAGDLAEDVQLMDSLKAEGYADPDGKLRSLPVILLANDIDDILQVSYLSFAGKKMAAKSDGETLHVFADGRGGFSKTPLQSHPWKPEYATSPPFGLPAFKLHTTLSCVIASKSARLGGVYKFRTTSRISGDQLCGSLFYLKRLTGGVLRGLPFRLVVRPMEVSPDGRKTTVYVVHMEMIGNDIAAIQSRALELARTEVMATKELKAAAVEYKALTAGEFTDDDDEAETAATFHPDQQGGQEPQQQPEQKPAPQVERPPYRDFAAEMDRTKVFFPRIVQRINKTWKNANLPADAAYTSVPAKYLVDALADLKKLPDGYGEQQQPQPDQPKGEYVPAGGDQNDRLKLVAEIEKVGKDFFGEAEFANWLDREQGIHPADVLNMADIKTLTEILEALRQEAATGVPY